MSSEVTTTESPATRTTHAKALPDPLPLAVAQLARSERGRQALGDLRALLKNGGAGLDRENQRALFEIMLRTFNGCSGTVLDALYPFRHETK